MSQGACRNVARGVAPLRAARASHSEAFWLSTGSSVRLEPDRATQTTLDISGYGAVTVDAIPKETIYDGLLETKFLQQVVITIDLEATRAWIAPRGR